MTVQRYADLLGMPWKMTADGLNGLCSEERSRTYVDSLDRMIACHPTIDDMYEFIDENRKEYGKTYNELRTLPEELLPQVINEIFAERIVSREELATNPENPDLLRRH